MVVGSQAILASWPESPIVLRTSGEIDAYPSNAKLWEAQHGIEASEEINALFGYLSPFHQAHGFYIDGVDDATATLPIDWRTRQVARAIECDGRTVFAIVPSVEDIAIAKLCRFDPSDQEYVRALHATRPLDREAMRDRLAVLDVDADCRARALAFLSDLARVVRG